MKCLLCSSVFENDQDLLQHYISFHRVDEDNKFSHKLLQPRKKSGFYKKCLRCDDF